MGLIHLLYLVPLILSLLNWMAKEEGNEKYK